MLELLIKMKGAVLYQAREPLVSREEIIKKLLTAVEKHLLPDESLILFQTSRPDPPSRTKPRFPLHVEIRRVREGQGRRRVLPQKMEEESNR